LVVAGGLAALATAGFTASSVLAAAPTAKTPAAASKTCSAGYVHAIIGGQEKCLKAGEFCSAQYQSGYGKYGFSCVSGRLEVSTSTIGSSGGSSGGSCGVERWTVKTLQDRPHLLRNRMTTVRYLVTRQAPSHLPSTRLPFERHVFTVVARVRFLREEADSDYHLILYEGGGHMIAEAPAPTCDPKAKPLYRREMKRARRAAKSCARARVTGVAFFDFKHGQTGVARNAIELHPILRFRCLSP